MSTNNPQGHNQHTGGQQGGNTRGGSHEQHVQAGQQSHKNAPGSQSSGNSQPSGTRGGSHEQHVKAGQQSHKNS